MTTTTETPARSVQPRTADWTRNHTRFAGAAYLITFATSIPAVLLLRPILTNPDYIVSAGSDSSVILACLLDAANALAAIATAVAVFPVVRRHNGALAMGFVTTRMFEAAVIMTGVISLLAVVSLRQQYAGDAGADQSSLVITGQALVTVRDYTFQFGPNLCAGLNALMFGTLLYRSGLVPRAIPAMGLVGAPLLIAAAVATIAGVTEQGSVWFVGALPVMAWELSIGTWMLVKGFRPTPATAVAPGRHA
jgi:hypothetical protein